MRPQKAVSPWRRTLRRERRGVAPVKVAEPATVHYIPCPGVHVDDVADFHECGHEDLSDLLEAVERRHVDEHSGAFRFCSEELCNAAAEVKP